MKASLLQWGFQASKSDTSLFIQHIDKDILPILIYVDDILITGSNSKHIEVVIHHLHCEFALKDLGVKVIPSIEGLHLSQTKYIGDILKMDNVLESKGCSTPISSSEKLYKDKGATFENPSIYRSIIGSRQYVLLTRPYIAYIVNKLS